MDTKTPAQTLRTPEQVLAWFRADGITVAGWCRGHGFSRSVVNSVLHRYTPGLRGEAHRAAVALGIKAAPEQA
jgi:gp16 family phage-associated protein